MKLLSILSLSLTLLSTTLNAQIKFQEEVPFENILAQAKKENKLVFMDCYTTWCGPCKWLVKNIFADQKIADTYNNQFINFKSDMEKGEGLELAKRYKVRMYPTLLWIDGNGEVVYTIVGTNTVEAFLDFASKVKNDENLFPNLVKRYEQGDRDPGFLKLLAETANLAYDPKAALYIDDYLNVIPKEKWTEEKNVSLLYTASKSFESMTTKFILEHPEKFDKETVETIKSQCLDNELKNVINSKSEEKLAGFFATIDKYTPERQEYKQSSELFFYRATNNRTRLNELASKYLKSSKDANLLNEYAWDRFEKETDAKLLKEAVVWAQRSVKLDKNYANIDTLGQLYQKVGDKKNAEKWLAESKKLEAKL